LNPLRSGLGEPAQPFEDLLGSLFAKPLSPATAPDSDACLSASRLAICSSLNNCAAFFGPVPEGASCPQRRAAPEPGVLRAGGGFRFDDRADLGGQVVADARQLLKAALGVGEDVGDAFRKIPIVRAALR